MTPAKKAPMYVEASKVLVEDPGPGPRGDNELSVGTHNATFI